MSTIVTRAGKGSALTHNEVDANFTNLNTDKIQSGNTVASLTVTSISGTTATYTNATISSADINGGTVDGTAIGSSSASSGAFTTLSSTGNTTLGNASGDTVTITGTVQPGMVISGSSSGDALRITQTGTGNALVVEDSTNPDSTPFVIDASGVVVAGYTSPIQVGDAAPLLQTHSAGSSGVVATRWSNNTFGPFFNLGKSRGAAIGTNTIVQAGDLLGSIQFCGDDGTDLITVAAVIRAEVDGTPGTNDMPGRLVFSTTADGASTPTERMQINSAGNVGIGITPTQKLHVSGNILATGSVDCGTQFLGLSTDSATAPSFSFTGDENTGMYRPGADQVALTVNGSARLTVSTTQFTGTLPWRGQNGSAAAPAISASADTNTGIYFPAADTLAFVEGGSEVMRINSSGNVGIGDTTPSYKLDVTGDINVTGDFRQNGTVFAGLTGGQTGSAPLYGARAWVNFNGTGTVAIRASGNVSSITDNGTGDYTVNFTTAMPDANYVVSGSATASGGADTYVWLGTGAGAYSNISRTTSAVRVQAIYSTSQLNDVSTVNVSIFR